MNINVVTLKMVKENTVQYDARKAITSPANIAHLLNEALDLPNNPEEQFYMIALDTKNKPVGIHLVSHGNINSSIVTPREVFKRAMLNNANAIIVAHNHPSGDTDPSNEDIKVTRRLKDAGEILGINVLDHIIVGEYGYCSLKEQGLM